MAFSPEELTMASKWLADALQMPAERRIGWLERLETSSRIKSLLQEALASESGTIAGEELSRDLVGIYPGREIGPYRPLRVLGHGGMGTVWLAERVDGLIKRPVALKLPHLGDRNPTFVERFHRERDILAALTHPYIARLYDAGFAANGQPYLALEYIERGVPITNYCNEQRLPVRARLTLFLQVLEAVQFAHLHQIIHRDLKPSNVLVTINGQVRLLDFGIAKLMADGQTSETELTRFGGHALTPTYASPEQIAGRSLSPASDVYSLGVILYELLAGVRPYHLKRESPAALEKTVLESQLIIPPSYRCIEPAVALMCTTTIKKWARTLKGDLDRIVMKALRKMPRERYQTVDAFAQDLERYLGGRPVLARPDSVWYRVTKFLGRNKGRVSAGSAIIASLAVGFGYAHWLYTSRVLPTPIETGDQTVHTDHMPTVPALVRPSISPTLSIQSDKGVVATNTIAMDKQSENSLTPRGQSQQIVDEPSGLPLPEKTTNRMFDGNVPSPPTKLVDVNRAAENYAEKPPISVSVKRHLTVATGPTGGIYSPMEAAVANILSAYLPGTEVTRKATSGSTDNIRMVVASEADIAFTLADTAWNAYKGYGPFPIVEPKPIRTIAVLYPNNLQLVTLRDAGINRIADLRGKRVSMGTKGSGTEFWGNRLLTAIGLDPDNDIVRSSLPVGPSAEALKKMEIDAFVWSSGVPTKVIADLAKTPGVKIQLLNTALAVPAMLRKYGPVYTNGDIAPNVYSGLGKTVSVAQVWNLLVARADMDDQTAYNIAKDLFEHKADLIAAHADAENIDIKSQGNGGSPIPFHNGAKKYYQEQGVRILR